MGNMVILVDKDDNEVGTAEKMQAHSNGGKLHRAFSVCVFNSKGELMLQRRAKTKYHAGGLWTNTTCSHPTPGEPTIAAAHRRLKEEMGFDCDLHEVFTFTYSADVGNGLTENEIDHVIFGDYDRPPKLNSEEADDWKWINIDELSKDVRVHPELYTPWLKISLDKIIKQKKSEL